MKITERRLRRVIRQVIRESMDYRGSLKSAMLEILSNLRNDVLACESNPRQCLQVINMSISRMSDEWNQAGGNQVGYFVDDCDVGREMDKIQMMVYRDSSLMPSDIVSELDRVFDVVENCNFLELEGK